MSTPQAVLKKPADLIKLRPLVGKLFSHLGAERFKKEAESDPELFITSLLLYMNESLSEDGYGRSLVMGAFYDSSLDQARKLLGR